MDIREIAAVLGIAALFGACAAAFLAPILAVAWVFS